MDPSVGKQLGIAVLVWTLYFLTIYFICNGLYLKLRGQPPKNPDAPVIVRGKPVPAVAAWQERDRRLRRLFLGIGAALMLLPLLLPFVFKRLFS